MRQDKGWRRARVCAAPNHVKPMFSVCSRHRSSRIVSLAVMSHTSRARVIRVTYSISRSANNCSCLKFRDDALVLDARENAAAQMSGHTDPQNRICVRPEGETPLIGRVKPQVHSIRSSCPSSNSSGTNTPDIRQLGLRDSSVRCRGHVGGPARSAP